MPIFQYITADVKRRTIYSTETNQSIQGNKFHRNLLYMPKYEYDMNLTITTEVDEINVNNEVKLLANLIHDLNGCKNTFLYQDPYDIGVKETIFGYGDGVKSYYQLCDSNFYPIQNINTLTSPYLTPPIFYASTGVLPGDILLGGYYIPETGIYYSGPIQPLGTTLLWTGQFLRECRLLDDNIQLTQVGWNTYTAFISFTTIIPFIDRTLTNWQGQ